MDSDAAIRRGLTVLVSALNREVDELQVRAYRHVLADVPADVITESVDRLLAELAAQPSGKRYFPTAVDWRAACNAVIVDRRRLVSAHHAEAQKTCPECNGTGWREVGDEEKTVIRCDCAVRAVQAIDAQPKALTAGQSDEEE